MEQSIIGDSKEFKLSIKISVAADETKSYTGFTLADFRGYNPNGYILQSLKDGSVVFNIDSRKEGLDGTSLYIACIKPELQLVSLQDIGISTINRMIWAFLKFKDIIPIQNLLFEIRAKRANIIESEAKAKFMDLLALSEWEHLFPMGIGEQYYVEEGKIPDVKSTILEVILCKKEVLSETDMKILFSIFSRIDSLIISIRYGKQDYIKSIYDQLVLVRTPETDEKLYLAPAIIEAIEQKDQVTLKMLLLDHKVLLKEEKYKKYHYRQDLTQSIIVEPLKRQDFDLFKRVVYELTRNPDFIDYTIYPGELFQVCFNKQNPELACDVADFLTRLLEETPECKIDVDTLGEHWNDVLKFLFVKGRPKLVARVINDVYLDLIKPQNYDEDRFGGSLFWGLKDINPVRILADEETKSAITMRIKETMGEANRMIEEKICKDPLDKEIIEAFNEWLEWASK